MVWKPKVCIHSTVCWKELLQVFDPRSKPWIRMEGAGTERIIEQVRKCPSGALSYFMNNPVPADSNNVVAEKADIATIEVMANGPYLVKTECLIVYGDGKQETKTGTVALCRCGNSQTKPYCDGSHRTTGFQG